MVSGASIWTTAREHVLQSILHLNHLCLEGIQSLSLGPESINFHSVELRHVVRSRARVPFFGPVGMLLRQ